MTSLLSAFPLLLPESATGDVYHGLMQCDGGRSFRIRVGCSGGSSPGTILPPAPLSKQHAYTNLIAEATARAAAKAAAEAQPPRHLLLQGEPALAQLLSGYAHMIRQRWHQSSDLASFLIELQEIVVRNTQHRARMDSQTGKATSRTSCSMRSLLCAPQNRILRTQRAATASSVSTVASSAASLAPLPPASLYAAILRDVGALPGGWSCVKSVNPETAREIELVVIDASKREHVMQLRLSEDYPRSTPSVQVDLPLPFNHAFAEAAESASAIAAPAPSGVASSASPISALYSRFSRLVSLCEPLWTSLDYLSSHAWVLEPEAPIPRSSLHRRLALGAGVWCDCTFDATRPLDQPPTIQILGNESAVEPMEKAMRERIQRGEWNSDEREATAETAAPSAAVAMDDSEGSAAVPAVVTPSAASSSAGALASPSLLHARLLRVLGLSSFPLSTPTNRDEFRLECMVCMVYKLEERTPDFVCPNPSCRRPAHTDPCLLSWLQALPDTREAYNKLHGSCPVCSHKIIIDRA